MVIVRMGTANEYEELCAFYRRPVTVTQAFVFYVTHATAFALTHSDCRHALSAAYKLEGIRHAASVLSPTHARLNLYDRYE